MGKSGDRSRAEHAHVELKRLRAVELHLREVGVRGIEQQVPLAAYRSGGDQQANGGIELIERAVTAESAVGSAQPFHGLLRIADQIDSTGIYARDADGAVGFSGSKASALAEAAGKGALRDAELARQNCIRDFE